MTVCRGCSTPWGRVTWTGGEADHGPPITPGAEGGQHGPGHEATGAIAEAGMTSPRGLVAPAARQPEGGNVTAAATRGSLAAKLVGAPLGWAPRAGCKRPAGDVPATSIAPPAAAPRGAPDGVAPTAPAAANW